MTPDPLTPLHRRFRYRADGPDCWTLLDAPSGVLQGDCEDFAITALWLICGKSWTKLWWRVATGRACIWQVRTSAGAPHACLWVKGSGWICNIHPQWQPKCPHRRVYPYLAPLMALKLAVKGGHA